MNNQKGFSILEIILATAIFAIFASSAVVALLSGLDASRLGKEETIAVQFTSEGIEAVKSIKNQDYNNLGINPTPRGVQRNANNLWEFKAESTSDTLANGKTYTRQLKVEDIDSDTKKVTSTTYWSFSPARQNSVNLVRYFTNWRDPLQTGIIMMAYSKTTATPFYRTWDGSNWSSEGTAQDVGGNINFVVLKSSGTRNETVLGTLDASGNIYAQVWNGSSWNTPELMANIGSSNSTSRSFDIAYEKSGGRAVFTYLAGSTSADFAYRIWDGSSWSAASTVTASPTTGVIKSIEMSQNSLSSSDEIALILADANSDIFGLVWNGSSWSNMGVGTVWDTTASASTVKKITDVAYEQISGRVMFIWADSVATDQYYRIWNGTSLTSATLLDIAGSGGIGEWIRLVARPDSNELLYGVQDAGLDLNTRKWSGSAWDTATQHPEHDSAVENATSMNFDLTWETHSTNQGKAWILWGDGARVTARQWSGSAWGSASTQTGSDDTSFLRLKADAATGAVFAGIYQNVTSAGGARDISERNLTGGSSSWSSKTIIWSGPTTAEPVHFKIDISTP